MRHNIQKLYEDVLRAIRELQEFCRDKVFNDFKQDRALQLVIERELEIIGEALSRIRRDFPEKADGIDDLDKIIGLRNVLAHGYDTIDHEILWDIVENKITALKANIEKKYHS